MPNPELPAELQTNLRRILNDMKQNQCVLLLGPEAMRINGKPAAEALRGHLAQYDGEEIAFYYEHDGLYLFDKDGKFDMQSEVSQFYRKQQPELGIAWQVATLPFSVVISINPDHALESAMRSYGLDVQAAYYHSSGAGIQQVEMPTQDKPLVYNLFGSVEKDASLILDYDDLLGFFRAVMGPTGLPVNLTNVLNDARSFLFVGFRFDRWYAQALLHLLTKGEKGKRKFTMDAHQPDGHTTDFLMGQFGIKFMDAGHDLLQLLHDEAQKRDAEGNEPPLLRKLIVPGSAEKANLIRLVMHPDHLPQVFEPLQELVKADAGTHTTVLTLQGRYNEWTQSRDRMDSRDVLIEINRIRHALLSIILSL